SRLASAIRAAPPSSAGVTTSAQALRRRSVTSSATSTRATERWERAVAAPPAISMGGVGAPRFGPATRRNLVPFPCGAVCDAGGVEPAAPTVVTLPDGRHLAADDV